MAKAIVFTFFYGLFVHYVNPSANLIFLMSAFFFGYYNGECHKTYNPFVLTLIWATSCFTIGNVLEYFILGNSSNLLPHSNKILYNTMSSSITYFAACVTARSVARE